MNIESYEKHFRRLRTRDAEGNGPRPWWAVGARTTEERLARIESLAERQRHQLAWLMEALGRAAPGILRAFEDARRDQLAAWDDDGFSADDAV